MKRLIAILLAAILFSPLFAERKTRIDRDGNYTVKIVWDSNRWRPEDNNFAYAANTGNSHGNLRERGWSSCLTYHYFVDESKCGYTQTGVWLYASASGAYQTVIANKLEDGLPIQWFKQDYYNYNDAMAAFQRIANQYEGWL